MSNVTAGSNDQWPAALADCTSLSELQLVGKSAPVLPDGRYLSRLQSLVWLSEQDGALPGTLAHASALRTLVLGLKPARIGRTSLSMLKTLRYLTDLSFVVCKQSLTGNDMRAVLHVQSLQQLSNTRIRFALDTEEGWWRSSL